MVFNLSVSQIRMQATNAILKSVRTKVHPLEIESERYFLSQKRIDLKNVFTGFIIGDLCNSVSLNEEYRGDWVRKTIDAYLEYLWNRFRDMGLILSRKQGDEISILVPKTLDDESIQVTADKVLQIARILNYEKDELKKVARKNGILLPFEFKFVCSSTRPDQKNSESIDLSPGGHLDQAYRTLEQVCLQGEVLVLGEILLDVSGREGMRKLSDGRLRGKMETVEIYQFTELNSKRLAS